MTAPMEWVSAMLRLGRKYQISFIADEAIERLKRAYPVTVTEYKLRNIVVEIQDYLGGGMGIVAVNLARSYGLNEILPFALYTCCQLSMEQLVNGIVFPNGNVERLPRGDIVRCLKGREMLMAKNLDFIKTLRKYTATPVDIHEGKCLHRIPLSDSTVLFTDLLGLTFRSLEGKICIPCAVQYQEVRMRFQTDVFTALPTFFTLSK